MEAEACGALHYEMETDDDGDVRSFAGASRQVLFIPLLFLFLYLHSLGLPCLSFYSDGS